MQRLSDRPASHLAAVPRAIGHAELSVKRRDGRSVIGRFRTSGAFRMLFPASRGRLDATMINIAGGLTGGDRLDLRAEVGAGACLALTSQAAERAYRTGGGTARVRSRLLVGRGGQLLWLPQELILFDGANLARELAIELATGARLLAVEPVIFGRAAMGERLRRVRFTDRITVTRERQPLFLDAVGFRGDVEAAMQRPGVGGSAGAMASVVYAAPDAEAHLGPLRAMLPDAAGATLLRPDLLALRMLAADGFELRRALVPVLDRLGNDTLPAAWRL